MPPRSVKMNRFIFGFQRRVWWPKWTPASSSSRMETTAKAAPFRLIWVAPAAADGTGARHRHHHPRIPRRVGCKNPRHRSSGPSGALLSGAARGDEPALGRLGSAITAAAWDLALEVVREGL